MEETLNESEDSDQPPPRCQSIITLSDYLNNKENNQNDKLFVNMNAKTIQTESISTSNSNKSSNDSSDSDDIPQRETPHPNSVNPISKPLRHRSRKRQEPAAITQSFDIASCKKRSRRDFDFGKCLGQGSFGSVYIVRSKIDHLQYAMKVISKKMTNSKQKKQFALIERDAMNRLNHPNIIHLKMTFQDRDSLYYLLELAENGDLSNVLNEYRALSPECSKIILAQIIHALGHMHSRRVLHRDIKPANILFDTDNRVKISDFGTAKLFQMTNVRNFDSPLKEKLQGQENHANEHRDPNFDYISKDEFDFSPSSFVGSPEYVSPEVLKFSKIGPTSDIWAFGCLVYTLYTGESPFNTESQYLTFEKIIHCEYTIPEYVPDDARDLIEKILILDPTKRLGYHNYDDMYSQIKMHPFFKDINWQTITQQSPPAWETFMPAYQDYQNKLMEKQAAEEELQTEEQLIKQTPGQLNKDGLCKEIVAVLSNYPRLFLCDAATPIQMKEDCTIIKTPHIYDSIAINPELKVEIVANDNSDLVILTSPKKTLQFSTNHSQAEEWKELLLEVLQEL